MISLHWHLCSTNPYKISPPPSPSTYVLSYLSFPTSCPNYFSTFLFLSISPMKLQGSDILPYGKCHTLQKTPKVVLLVTLALVLLTIIPLYYPLLGYPLFLLKNISSSSSSSSPSPSSSSSSFSSQPSSSHVNTPLEDDPIRVEEPTVKKCDIFSGEWIRNPKAPYYINTTCWAIHEHQNCMKYGRPDLDFMKWRWKPDGCELPIFNPAQFLELMRDKTLAFVGDSVARNHMQSLMCLLSRVCPSALLPFCPFKHYLYSHQFTISKLLFHAFFYFY